MRYLQRLQNYKEWDLFKDFKSTKWDIITDFKATKELHISVHRQNQRKDKNNERRHLGKLMTEWELTLKYSINSFPVIFDPLISLTTRLFGASSVLTNSWTCIWKSDSISAKKELKFCRGYTLQMIAKESKPP